MALHSDSRTAGRIDRSSYPDLTAADVELCWMRASDFVEDRLAPFFHQIDVTSGTSIKISNVGGEYPLLREAEDGGNRPVAKPPAGYDKTYSFDFLKLFLQVTRTALKTDRHDKIMSMVQKFAIAPQLTMAYRRASILNNAMSGALSGADSKDLCDDDHPQESGSATWDNLGTGPMSGANLQALVLLLDLIDTPNGDPTMIEAKACVTGSYKWQKLLELVGSKLRAEDSFNAETVVIDNLVPMKCKYLTETSSAAPYFVFGNATGEDKGLFEIYLTRPSLDDVGDETVDVPISMRAVLEGAVDFHISKNIAGSAGS